MKRPWMNRHVTDKFVKRSLDEKTRSRAFYKLDEINSKFRLIKPRNSIVLDLGAAPGGWSMAVSRHCKSGVLISVDLNRMEPISSTPEFECHFLQGDFTKQVVQNEIVNLIPPGKRADVILSDILHNVTGDKSRDHHISINLLNSVFSFAQAYLRPGGNLVGKFLNGADTQEAVMDEWNKSFSNVTLVKPKASRPESREIYVVGVGKL